MITRTLCLLVPFLCTPFTLAALDEAPVRNQYSALAHATSITQEGQAPFHLRVDAQFFDLEGKPSEKATIEEWWGSPTRYRIEISSSTLHVVNSSLSSEVQGPLSVRSRYLSDKLLNEITQPLPGLQEKEVVQRIQRDLAGMAMTCIGVGYVEPIGRFLCSDVNHQLRVVQTDQSATVRNHLSKFHDSTVPLSVSISYLGREAVVGTVSVLQAFEPEKSSLQEFRSTSPLNQSFLGVNAAAAGVTAGRKTGGQAPVYPEGARRARVTGQVVLCAVISPEGRVTETAVIATSSPLLTKAANDAIKTWTYLPFLVDGKATQIVSTMTVNFNIQ